MRGRKESKKVFLKKERKDKGWKKKVEKSKKGRKEHNKGRNRSSTVACAFEALLGAFYLSGKLDETQVLIEKLFEKYIEEVNADSAKSNYKAMLQEYFQVYSNSVPKYILTNLW